MCIGLACTTIMGFMPLQGAAQQAVNLDRGLYMGAPATCAQPGGAATLSFDGKYFIQRRIKCSVVAKSGKPQTYTATCSEGDDPKTAETSEWNLALTSRRSFTLNGNKYSFCGAEP